jgi:hypothetical protein
MPSCDAGAPSCPVSPLSTDMLSGNVTLLQHPPALTIAAWAPAALLVGEQSLVAPLFPCFSCAPCSFLRQPHLPQVSFVMSTNGEQVRS